MGVKATKTTPREGERKSRPQEQSGCGLGMDFVIALEGAHVRIKRAGAVELDHLPNVPQVVKGKLVEQLAAAEHAKLFVSSGAGAHRRGQGVQPR